MIIIVVAFPYFISFFPNNSGAYNTIMKFMKTKEKKEKTKTAIFCEGYRAVDLCLVCFPFNIVL